jgi:hypothetical protein
MPVLHRPLVSLACSTPLCIYSARGQLTKKTGPCVCVCARLSRCCNLRTASSYALLTSGLPADKGMCKSQVCVPLLLSSPPRVAISIPRDRCSVLSLRSEARVLFCESGWSTARQTLSVTDGNDDVSGNLIRLGTRKGKGCVAGDTPCVCHYNPSWSIISFRASLAAFLSMSFWRRFVACQATRGSRRAMRSALKRNDVCGSSLDLISLSMTLFRLIAANSEDCTGRCRSSIPFTGDEFRTIMAGKVHHEPKVLHHDTQTSILGFQVFCWCPFIFLTHGAAATV